uniref:MAT1-1-1 n=1 Tax=Acephala applanata TaxID=327282 RepID=D9J2E4_9HELO|nr:MAT1-1-1 [Acephala applanata]ADJ38501.1 MAT1-1-1 [Acephala applanata]
MPPLTSSMPKEHANCHNPNIHRRHKFPKKALNSWMAFRVYYKRIFPTLQQKEASQYLTILWQRDPFKAKWAVIAAAYSKIRDEVGKQNAPLDRFLSIVCPKIGIVDDERYLNQLNWTTSQVVTDDNVAIITWKQTAEPVLATFGHDILYSTMTVDDIVEFCASRGYVSKTPLGRLRRGHHHPDNSSNYDLSKASMSGRGLFVSGPTLPSQPASISMERLTTCPAAPGTEPSLATRACPASSRYREVDVSRLQWTGSMSEVYSPAEGSADLERSVNREKGVSLFHRS